jgi:hypothetical protein
MTCEHLPDNDEACASCEAEYERIRSECKCICDNLDPSGSFWKYVSDDTYETLEEWQEIHYKLTDPEQLLYKDWLEMEEYDDVEYLDV